MEEGLVYREAALADIEQMHVVRVSVKENALSDPGRITLEDYAEFLSERGKGWVCEDDSSIVGFAVVDVHDHNIWALFIHPDLEGKGIGKQLHRLMLDWYFNCYSDALWLSTAPGTRAEQFYHKQGWKETGMYGNEIKFEMTHSDWMASE